MPSPIGHAVAGATVAWAADALAPAGRRAPSRPFGPLTIAAVAAATAPDLDLAFHVHRTVTHSVAATAIVGAIAAIVAARTRAPILHVALVCAAAHASHLLLDWLAIDNYPPYGLQALWPFSHDFYISGLGVFRQTQRREVFGAVAMRANTLAIAREIAILGPIALIAWWGSARAARRRSSGPEGLRYSYKS
jgi:inner membrane protein